jgi:hypothetical protein
VVLKQSSVWGIIDTFAIMATFMVRLLATSIAIIQTIRRTGIPGFPWQSIRLTSRRWPASSAEKRESSRVCAHAPTRTESVLICGRTFLIRFTRGDATRRWIAFPSVRLIREETGSGVGKAADAVLLVARSYFICDSRVHMASYNCQVYDGFATYHCSPGDKASSKRVRKVMAHEKYC